MLLEHGMFNVALQTLIDKDRKKCPNLKVPLFLQEVYLIALVIIMSLIDVSVHRRNNTFTFIITHLLVVNDRRSGSFIFLSVFYTVRKK